jgi:hypothetical protein
MSVLHGTSSFAYEITASSEGADYLGGSRIRAVTEKEALERAREMADRKMHHIRITGPDGKSFAPPTDEKRAEQRTREMELTLQINPRPRWRMV